MSAERIIDLIRKQLLFLAEASKKAAETEEKEERQERERIVQIHQRNNWLLEQTQAKQLFETINQRILDSQGKVILQPSRQLEEHHWDAGDSGGFYQEWTSHSDVAYCALKWTEAINGKGQSEVLVLTVDTSEGATDCFTGISLDNEVFGEINRDDLRRRSRRLCTYEERNGLIDIGHGLERKITSKPLNEIVEEEVTKAFAIMMSLDRRKKITPTSF